MSHALKLEGISKEFNRLKKLFIHFQSEERTNKELERLISYGAICEGLVEVAHSLAVYADTSEREKQTSLRLKKAYKFIADSRSR